MSGPVMENLAPAGNRASLERAIAAGADAVYLAYASFGARAGAGNFDEAELRDAVALAHLHHVRVHVTVNTLVKDGELEAVEKVLRLLDTLRVDAVLVQDLGVLDLVLRRFPGLAVHASTQMAIHHASGARWCRRMGMKRVVLARECSLSEIALAAREDIEIEVFGHGAQCVAVSGQCLFSSMVGERSGNRGRCAQPCRQRCVFRGREGAWQSPRDVCLRDELPALARAGAVSVKLEGRLRRPEYVAAVTGSYRRGLDSLSAGAFRKADAEERRDLLQAFHRGGFMGGYAMGCEDAAVIDPARVNHGGVLIGTVQEGRPGLVRVRLSLPLHDGDQLRVVSSEDIELIYAGPETAQGGSALVRLRDGLAAKPGDPVFRLTDAAQMEAMRALPLPRIPAEAVLRVWPGKPMSLEVTDGVSTVRAEGDTVQPARSRALTAEDALRSIGRTGDTAFDLTAFRLEGEGAFVPVSRLNALRREALERLAAERSRAFALPAQPEREAEALPLPAAAVPDTLVFRHSGQLKAVPAGWRLVCSPEDWREDALRALLSGLPEGCWLQLPMVCEDATLRMIRHLTGIYRGRLGGVVLGSVGQLGLDWPLPFGAGSGVPVMNRRAAGFLLAASCAFVTASPELSGRELETLMAGGPPILVPARGRVQLMLLHHCPARTALGLHSGHAACTLCDRGAPESLRGAVLEDLRGHSYPLQRVRLPEGCRVRLLNDRPTDIAERCAARGWACLTELSAEEDLAELESLVSTAGHWQRPVE